MTIQSRSDGKAKKKSEQKYKIVRDHIQNLIDTGELAIGDQLPTDAVLVEQFGVSRPTVARAMSDLVFAGVLERRAGAGSFVRGTPTVKQQSMIGLLIPGLGETEIFEPICSEIASICPRHHFNLIWGDMPLHDGSALAEKSIALCRKYIEDKVTGIFWSPLELSDKMENTNQKIAEMLSEAKIAVIMLDRDFEHYPHRSKFDLVGIDNVRAGYAQTEHLLRHGVRKIVYFARRQSASTVRQRVHGFHMAKLDHGQKTLGTDTVFGNPSDPESIDELLALKPEAVVCANDITAGLLMRSLLDRGIKIPSKIRIVGLDDVRYSNLFSVSLTTLHQPCRKIGNAAVAAMAQRIANPHTPPREIRLDFTLKVRESCGCK